MNKKTDLGEKKRYTFPNRLGSETDNKSSELHARKRAKKSDREREQKSSNKHQNRLQIEF